MSNQDTFAAAKARVQARSLTPALNDEDRSGRARKRMDRFDNLPPDVRAVVHVAGGDFVSEMLSLGVTKGKRMWHILEAARGIAQGDEGIRDSPNEAEIDFIANQLAMHYARANHKPTAADRIVAKLLAKAVWSNLRWGRCMCFGTLPIVYRQPLQRESEAKERTP